MPINVHQGRTFDVELVQDPKHVGFLLEKQPEQSILERAFKTRNWTPLGILDQGADGACVGFGCAGNCGCTPKPQKDVSNAVGLKLYHEAQTLDEWPGTNYDGTSLTGGMKALQKENRIGSYLWLQNAAQVALTIGYLSAVVIAVPWKQNMMDVDEDGLVHATGDDVGGHCVNLCGFNATSRRFKIQQSWGPDWGVKGFAWLSFDDLNVLLQQSGQAAVTRKRSAE